MRVFPPLKITNEELGQIAEYDESLEGNHLHVPLVDPGAALSQHHWMTLFPLEDGSADEVVHHIDHIIAQVTGQRLFQMEEAKKRPKRDTCKKRYTSSRTCWPAFKWMTLHPPRCKTAWPALALLDDINGALHHLDHFMERMGGDQAAASLVAEIRELLESGDINDAAHELGELTGTAHEEEHEADGQAH